MQIRIFPTEDEVIDAYAAFFVEAGQSSILGKGRFDVALSGGNSPKRVFEMLASDRYRNLLDWTKVHFFFGDERNVASDDPEFNGKMAEQALFQPLKICESQIFKVPTFMGPIEAANQYWETIKAHFQDEAISFDLVMLGLGDDAHTASLFPNTEILNSETASVQAVWVEKLQSYRISFTAPLINLAKNRAFLVFGKGKAGAVKHVLRGPKDTNQYPAQLIAGQTESLYWFVDQTAYTNA